MVHYFVRKRVPGKYWWTGFLSALCLWAWMGASASGSGLSIDERAAAQRAIEEVYWKHTIWPNENSPKPPLSEVMSEEEIRKKVEETLKMSKALEEVWRHPITGSDLQAEMERMAETTRDAETLRELWNALGNDPQLIAECLARPLLVERLIHDWYAFDKRYHGRLKNRAMRGIRGHGRIEAMKGTSGEYHEVEWKKGKNTGEKTKDTMDGDVLELTEDEWQEETGQLAGIFGVSNEEEIPLRRVSALQEDSERFYVLEVLGKGEDSLQVGVMEWRKVGFVNGGLRSVSGLPLRWKPSHTVITCRRLHQEPPNHTPPTPGLQRLLLQPRLPVSGRRGCGRARR